MKNPHTAWSRIGMDAWALGMEASTVVGLRMFKLALGGPAAPAEAQRMVSEKLETFASLQAMAMTGALGVTAPGVAGRSIALYRRRVRANRRRLSGV